MLFRFLLKRKTANLGTRFDQNANVGNKLLVLLKMSVVPWHQNLFYPTVHSASSRSTGPKTHVLRWYKGDHFVNFPTPVYMRKLRFIPTLLLCLPDLFLATRSLTEECAQCLSVQFSWHGRGQHHHGHF